MKKVIILSLFSLFLLIENLFSKEGTSYLDPVSYENFSNIYNLDFNLVNISGDTKSDDELLINYLLTTHFNWWQILSEENNHALKGEAIVYIDRATSEIRQKRRREMSDRDLFVLVSLYGFKSRIALLDNNLWSAFWSLEESMSFMRNVLKNHEQNEPFSLLSGIYLYNMHHLVKTYPIFAPAVLFYPKGNREEGIALLQKASNAGDTFISLEANYFLMKIFIEIEENYTAALRHTRRLVDFAPNNYIFQYFHIQCMLNTGYPEDIILERYQQVFKSLENNTVLSVSGKAHLMSKFKSLEKMLFALK